MTDTPTETGQVRPFAAVLQDIDNGTLADQLGIDMQTLVNAVVELGRKGSLTIKFEVSRLKGNSGALSLTARHDLKLPQEEPTESVFFTDDLGNLQRNDPRQLAIPGSVREVPNPYENREVRTV